MAKPNRTFSGSVGERSTGTAGPESLKTDIGNAMAMFDPDKLLADGSAGGLGIENMREVPALKTDFDAHAALTAGVHGAVSAATASKIVIRDAAGRAQVADPSAASDIATKSYIDAHTSLSTAHGAGSAATPNTIIVRDAGGRAKVAAPIEDDDIARKADVETAGGSYASLVAFNAHVAATSVHGATSTATSNVLMIRDASGRAQVIAPSDANDIAIKQTVDDHAGLTAGIHGATSAATAAKLVIRDASGRAKVADPAASDDIATKAVVDAVQANLTAHTGAGSPHSGHATTSDLNSHTASTSAHSATSAATASKIMMRDVAGRAKVAAPSAEDDVALKSNVTTVQGNLDTHAGLTTGVHGAVSAATASKILIRDVAGRAKVVAPSAEDDIALKSNVTTVQGNLDTHTALTTGVHGAVATATASKILIRDAAGRGKVVAPSAEDDIALKSNVTTAEGALTTHAALTTAHGAVSAATASKMVVRDASGRAAFADPSAVGDAATKNYVDTHGALTTGVHGVGASTVESASGSQGKVDTHAALTTAHGAVSAATASKILIRDVAGRAKVVAPSAEDDIALKSNVTTVQTNLDAEMHATTGHLHTGGAGDAPLLPMYASYYAASDTLLDSHDAEVSAAPGTSYTLKKSIRVLVAGVYRVKFDLKTSQEDNSSGGRIYKNGVGYGTPRISVPPYTTYYTWSEDLLFLVGDTCELWLKANVATTYAQNFRLYGTITTPPFTHVV